MLKKLPYKNSRKNCKCFIFIAVFLLIIPSITHADAIYFETESPLNGWMNYRLIGPDNLRVGSINVFTLEMRPVDYETSAHHYKWVTESWTIGDPNLQVGLLLPLNSFVVSKNVCFEGREVIHGKSIPGEWIEFIEIDESSSWTKTIIGEILSNIIGGLGGIVLSFASFAEMLGEISEEQEALEIFNSDEYERISLSLPKPTDDFCATNIKFGITFPNAIPDKLGIILKVDKRTLLGQYDAEYHILEFFENHGENIPSEELPSSKADIALIIDSSGSMTDNDPNNLRISASEFLIELTELGTQITVIDFDDESKVLIPLTYIGNKSTCNFLIEAANMVDSDGGTNLGRGLEEGYNELIKSQTPDTPKVAIFLTDGEGDYNNQAQLYIDEEWTIYTLGLGSEVNETLLKEIAQLTPDGEYFPVSLDNIQTVYNKIITRIIGGSIILSYNGYINPLQKILLPCFYIDNTISELTVSGNLQGSSITLVLNDPNGNVFDPYTTNEDITYQESETFVFYKIKNPTIGQWNIEVTGTDIPKAGETFNVSVTADTPVYANMLPLEPTYSTGETVIIGINLKEKISENKFSEITGAEVSANIISPDGTSIAITLYDDGTHGDNSANDGVYTYQYTELNAVGNYFIQVDTDNNEIPDIQETFHVGLYDQVSFDGSSLLPVPDSIVDEYRPSIQAVIMGNGENIDFSSIELTLDNFRVSFVFNPVNQTITYIPQSDMNIGTHFVKFKGRDVNGNEILSSNWSFSIIQEGDLIKNFGLAEAPWPMFGHDPQHTNKTEYFGPQMPKLKWKIENSEHSTSIPAIGNNIIYLATHTQNLYDYGEQSISAISTNGDLLWEHKEYSNYTGYPIIRNDESVIIATDAFFAKDHLLALNQQGQTIWNFSLKDLGFLPTLTGSPCIDKEGNIYIGSYKKILAIDSLGNLKWQFETNGSVYSPCIGIFGSIYFVSDIYLYAISQDGDLNWKYEIGKGNTSPSVDSNGIIYVSSSMILI